MPSSFEATWLWRSAFADNRDPKVTEAEKTFFRQHLLELRERVKPLVARIAADMPGYTVHNVTHLDALWETASLVAEPNLALSPPEAFVLGGAMLLHDAAMTLAAYPGGLVELTTKWADIAAIYAGGPSTDNPLPEVELRIKVEVLRQLHAEKAEDLPTQAWRTSVDSDQAIFLIDQPELRRFYGRTIGILAHSHWWTISKVERELSRFLGALPPHTRSEVDLLKIAGLLRVADVLHLDRRRAPFFSRVLENPSGLSADHWKFQERLAFPRLRDDAFIFTSGEAFELKDAGAWWLAFDTLTMADRELVDADRLLRSHDRAGLVARRVDGVGNPSEMARHIPVSGWRPVDTRMRVSDIPKIVRIFGGERLYGHEQTVPLRELLQNAIDAVQARRLLQGRASDWGLITVELANREDGIWLSVEDTGIGMSEAVLTGSLLDFGASFWGSTRMVEEFPGLAAKGMASLGKFGIGFFSVFMLGDHVRVITRRPDRAESDALLLEFHNGISSRPVLSTPSPGAIPPDGGTRVEIRLRWDPRVADGITLGKPGDRDEKVNWASLGLKSVFGSLLELVGWIAPASPVSIDVSQFTARTRAVRANDWLDLSSTELLKRLSGLPVMRSSSEYLNMIRLIPNDRGDIVGRAALLPTILLNNTQGVLVAGGLRIMNYPNWAGILLGEVSKIDRRAGETHLSARATAGWISVQVGLVHAAKLDPEEKARFADLALSYGASIEDLPIARVKESWVNSTEFARELNNLDQIVLEIDHLSYDGDIDNVPKWEFEQYFKPSDDVVFLPFFWNFMLGDPRSSPIGRHTLGICENIWGGYEEQNEDDRLVGHVHREEIRRQITIYRKPRFDKSQ